MKLIDKSEELFSEIEPRLVSIARSYKVHDPVGEARSYFARFSEILGKFDSGHYTKTYLDTNNQRKPLPENPSDEIFTLYKRTLFSYLATAFSNDCLLASRKSKRESPMEQSSEEWFEETGTNMGASAAYSQSHFISSHDMVDIIKLSDMVAIIALDLKRMKSMASVSRDDINCLFMTAVHNYYKNMLDTLGDFPIVRDIEAHDSGEFFVYDLREGKTEGIQKELALLVEKQPRTIALMCKKLLAPDSGYFAINRKISRYFSDYQKGMPTRLRESKKKL